MDTKSHAADLLLAYEDLFPSERLHSLRQFLSMNSGNRLFGRKNFTGHITASALVLDKSRKKILLLAHKYLHIELPPGGHVDEADHFIIDAAYRETEEEAGIDRKDLELLPSDRNIHVPFDIDTHLLPENKHKNEPPHIHHDFRYLFVYRSDKPVTPDPGETTGARWVELDQLSGHPIHERVVKKMIDKKISSL